MGQIQYSDKYFDDTFEYRYVYSFNFVSKISTRALICCCVRTYRHVVLPPDTAKLLPKNRLLSEVSFIIRVPDSVIVI